MKRSVSTVVLAVLALTPSVADSFGRSLALVPDTVYVTKSGDKYHSAGCRYLKKTRISMDRSEAQRNGYTPCRVCKP